MDIWVANSTQYEDVDPLLPDGGTTPGVTEDLQDGQEDPQNKDIPQDTKVMTYKRRWYVLMLFCALAFVQGGVWNSWAPIAASSKRAFYWTDNSIYLLTNWGPITYIITTAFFTWMMDEKGMRWSTVVIAVLTAAGCGLRCITSNTPTATWLMHAGQIVNDLGGPVGMGGGPALSAVWFPPDQRTTSTALAAVINGLGVSMSFILGPMLVPDPANCTSPHNSSNSSQDCINKDIHFLRGKIMNLMYIEFGMAAVICLMVIAYFPTKPPKPPSITASIDRLDFLQAVKALFRHKGFWLLGIPYAVGLGVYSAWIAILDTNLQPFNISQDEAGWLGFYSSVAGCLAGLVMGIFADRFKKRMKLYLITLFSFATVMFVIFTLMYVKIIPFTTAILYSTVILGSLFLTAAIPLFFELCCECTYPIAEGVTNGWLTFLNNVAALFFLLILMIPGIGKSWMNWFNVGCIIVSIPVLVLFKENYGRLDVDLDNSSRSSSFTHVGDDSPEGQINTQHVTEDRLIN